MTELLLIFLGAALLNDLVLAGFFDRAAGQPIRGRTGVSVVAALLLIIVAALHGSGTADSLLPTQARLYLLTLAFMTTAIAVAPKSASGAVLVNTDLLRIRRQLPLLVANLVVLAFALLDARQARTLPGILGFCLAASIGFAVVAALFSAMRQRLAAANVSQTWRGTPLTVLTACLMALATMGAVGSLPW